jgi:molybdate transport system substrate-binding protein
MAARDVLREMASRYERETSRVVSTEAAGGIEVARRVRDGETADVVVLASNVIDALIGEGRLISGSRVDLVRSGIAIAVRADGARPDVGTEGQVRSAVLAARSVSYSSGPSGVYLEGLFDRWGILPAIRGRIVVPPPGVAVGSLVASGTAEIGFQQLSELSNVAGIQILGPLPPEIQSMTIFSGGVPVSSAHPTRARELLAFMASPATAALKVLHGMEAAP